MLWIDLVLSIFRKVTLINKAHELAEFCEVDAALIIRSRKSG
jgi:hypothetical protein